LLDALPAPIYYLNVDDSQIWRVEQDAVSLTQITFEGSPVIDFDVSPKDGSLVYISGDELIYYATMLGGRRQVLMQSGEVFEQNKGLTEINSAVRRPRWSPDGSLIAYARGGIHLHRDPAANPQEGVPESRLVRANDPLPDPVPDEDDVFEFEGPQSWYWPLSWLPDGQRILVRISSYGALGSGMAILNIEDGSLSEMKLADDVPCCFNFMTWGNESGRLLQAGRLPVIGSTGLWRSDPLTGESTTLIPDKAGGQFHLFAFPLELGDRVYGFYASASSAAAQPLPLRPMVMVSVAANGSAEFEQLRDDYWVVGQADWLPDGSGAVISDVAGNPGFGPYDGILRWLSSDGGPAVKLPAAGQQPQWGYMPNS
jgi:hypothetical protein